MTAAQEHTHKIVIVERSPLGMSKGGALGAMPSGTSIVRNGPTRHIGA
jgi:hypothetical protein